MSVSLCLSIPFQSYLHVSVSVPISLFSSRFVFISLHLPSVCLSRLISVSVSLCNCLSLSLFRVILDSHFTSIILPSCLSHSLHVSLSPSLSLPIFFFLFPSSSVSFPFRLTPPGNEPCPRAGCVPTRCILHEMINK